MPGTETVTDVRERLLAQNINGGHSADMLEAYMKSGKPFSKPHGGLLGAISHIDEHNTEVAKRVNALGESAIKIKFYDSTDPEGKRGLKNKYFTDPFTGERTLTDDDGNVIYTNKKVLQEYLAAKDYREKKLDKITAMCLAGNEVCAAILQVPMSTINEFLAPKKTFPNILGEPISTKLADEDGRPDSMRYMVPQSKEQLAALAKLRAFVERRLDYVRIADFDRDVNDNTDGTQDPIDIDYDMASQKIKGVAEKPTKVERGPAKTE